MALRTALALLGVAAAALCSPGARADTVVAGLSDTLVRIESNFVGTELVLFGTIEPASPADAWGRFFDVAVVVRGPPHEAVTRRKEPVAGIWINRDQVTFVDAPSYFAVLASRPLALLGPRGELESRAIGLDVLPLEVAPGASADDVDSFREAFIRRRQAEGLFIESGRAVQFMTQRMFFTRVPLPAHIRVGRYSAEIHVFADGEPVATGNLGFWVRKTGFEATISQTAERRPLLYGLGAVAVALFAGWFAGVIFRRD